MLERPAHSPSRAAELKAARGRRYRARVKACRIIVGVEIGGDELGLLLRTGWLQERDAADARAIGAAVARLLADSAAQ